MANKIAQYGALLKAVKGRIQQARTRAILSANAEMVLMYWDIGRMIHERQKQEGWGAKVVPKLARDIRTELAEVKGFSERNINRMITFYRAYPYLNVILPQAVAKLSKDTSAADSEGRDTSDHLQRVIARIPWGHHILLIEKIKDLDIRLWYMHRTIGEGWSRNVLDHMIRSKAYERQGEAVTNFEDRLPAPQSDLARESFKDPYIFDFLTLDEPFREQELESGLLHHLEQFLLELGSGFSFVGRQFHLEVGDDDFYLDLLFYHLRLRCFVVIDLKTGPFKPEYAGKMNFYLNVVDDHLKHETDHPSIGLILCQDKKKILAEYALRGMQKPIGVSDYELTRSLPDNLKSNLPTIEELEAELGENAKS